MDGYTTLARTFSVARLELARLRHENATSAHLLENRARSELSPAFSPSVQEFVTTVMAGGSVASIYAGPLSGRTPLGPGNEHTPITPGGGDFLQTPRTAANPSTSLRPSVCLSFIKDETVRLRGEKGMLRRRVEKRGRGRKKMEPDFADVLASLIPKSRLIHSYLYSSPPPHP